MGLRGKLTGALLIALMLLSFTEANSQTTDPLEANRKAALKHFPEQRVHQMRKEAAALEPLFPGVRPFSSAQFGTDFVTGTMNVFDIFDARIPGNRASFEKYAVDKDLLQEEGHILDRYAKAATSFLKEYGYDAVLYRPDEFHPVFTQASDTWMFVREPPQGSRPDGKRYFSSRVTDRTIAIHGGWGHGYDQGQLGLKRWGSHFFWVPGGSEKYDSYSTPKTRTIAASGRPDFLNRYQPAAGSSAQIQARHRDGHIACPLSGRQGLKVGLWAVPASAKMHHEDGVWFWGLDAKDDELTYGTHGFYVLPLHPDFWK